MGLTAAVKGKCRRRAHWNVTSRDRGRIDTAKAFGSGGPCVAGGIRLAGARRRHGRVVMRGHFGRQQGNVLLAADFAQVAQGKAGALALLQWRRSLKVRQREGALAVAAIGGAKQGEERSVLADGQELAITKGPARWGKVSCKYSDFGYKTY